MSETKHTPGPWRLKRDRSGEEYGAIVGADDVLVATTGYRVAVGSGEDNANAKLVAAAPDLLSALTDVMAWISNWDPNFTSDDEWPASRDRARAAISRATGGRDE